MPEVAVAAERRWTDDLRLPPLRFWVALVLLAAEVVFLEKATAVTSGGITGLTLPLAHWLGIRVGTVMLALKSLILLVVLRWGGRNVALWTAVATVVTSALTWLMEALPWQPHWSIWAALPFLFGLSGSAISLMWNAGYSSGGYAALAQVLRVRRGIPVSLSMLAQNVLGLLFMYLAFGVISGSLSLVMCLMHGPMAGLWQRIWGRLLPPVPGAVPLGAGALAPASEMP